MYRIFIDNQLAWVTLAVVSTVASFRCNCCFVIVSIFGCEPEWQQPNPPAHVKFEFQLCYDEVASNANWLPPNRSGHFIVSSICTCRAPSSVFVFGLQCSVFGLQVFSSLFSWRVSSPPVLLFWPTSVSSECTIFGLAEHPFPSNIK